MLGKPKYKYNDIVRFHTWKDYSPIHEGKIIVVDSYGTSEFKDDVSYDIQNDKEKVLYKHIKEELIVGYASPRRGE